MNMHRIRFIVPVGLGAVLLSFQLGCAMQPGASVRDLPSSNREVVRASFDRWSDRTGGPFELLVADAEWTIVGSSPLSKTYRSRQQFLDEVITPFNARLADPLTPSIRGIFADGEVVVVLFDAAAVARDGTPYRNTYSWYLWMKDGMIVKAVAFFDTRLFDEFWTRVSPGK